MIFSAKKEKNMNTNPRNRANLVRAIYLLGFIATLGGLIYSVWYLHDKSFVVTVQPNKSPKISCLNSLRNEAELTGFLISAMNRGDTTNSISRLRDILVAQLHFKYHLEECKVTSRDLYLKSLISSNSELIQKFLSHNEIGQNMINKQPILKNPSYNKKLHLHGEILIRLLTTLENNNNFVKQHLNQKYGN